MFWNHPLPRLSRRAAVLFAVAVAVLAALLAVGHRQSAADAASRADHLMVPTKVTTRGMSQWAQYGSSKPRPHSNPQLARHRVSARVAQDEQDAAFAVLRRPQSAGAASDPILGQIAAHQPSIDTARAQPLDSSHRYWLLPTRDGQICVGKKTTGVQTFLDACGYDDVVDAGGLAMTSDDRLIGLVPDGATAIHDQDGHPVSMHGNAFSASVGARVTFVLHGQTHHLG